METPQGDPDLHDPSKTNTVFDDDDLDTAVASADDTGMIAGRQLVVRSETEIEPEPD